MMRVLALALLLAAADVMASYTCCGNSYYANDCKNFCERDSCKSGYRGEVRRRGACKGYWLGRCRLRCEPKCTYYMRNYGCGCGKGVKTDCGDGITACGACPSKCKTVKLSNVRESESDRSVTPSLSKATVSVVVENCKEGVGVITQSFTATSEKSLTTSETYSFDKTMTEGMSWGMEASLRIQVSGGFGVPFVTEGQVEVETSLTQTMEKTKEFSLTKGHQKTKEETTTQAIESGGEWPVKNGYKVTLAQTFSNMSYQTKFTATAQCYDAEDNPVGEKKEIHGTYDGQGFAGQGAFKTVKSELCTDDYLPPVGCQCVDTTRRDGAHFTAKCQESPTTKQHICYVKPADSCKNTKSSGQSDYDFVVCEVNQEVGDDEGPAKIDCMEAEKDVCQEEDHCTWLDFDEGFEGGCFDTSFIKLAESIRDAHEDGEEEDEFVPCSEIDDFKVCKKERDDCKWFGRQADGKCESEDYVRCDAGGKKMNKRKCNAIEGCMWAKKKCTPEV